jgi:hypothetical protein
VAVEIRWDDFVQEAVFPGPQVAGGFTEKQEIRFGDPGGFYRVSHVQSLLQPDITLPVTNAAARIHPSDYLSASKFHNENHFSSGLFRLYSSISEDHIAASAFEEEN